MILAWLLALPFAIDVSLSNPTVKIDETLKVEVTFHYPQGYQVDLDTVRLNLLKYGELSEPPFSLANESIKETAEGLKAVYTLEPQLEGIFFISLYNVPFKKEGGETEEVISPIFPVEVQLPSVPANYKGTTYPLLSLVERYPLKIEAKNLEANTEEEIQEAKKILNSKILPWAQILIIIFLAVLYLIIRTNRDEKVKMVKKGITPEEAKSSAIRSLEASENDFAAIADTLRLYIEDRFHIAATRQTTEEFLRSMSTSPLFDASTQESLSSFLFKTDQVKFAVQTPEAVDYSEALRLAREFIQK